MHAPTRRFLATSVIGGVVLLGANGCYVERPCGEGQTPVGVPGGTGASCVLPGQTVPPGYATYQPGHTPTEATDMGASATWLSTPVPTPTSTRPSTASRTPASTPAPTPATTAP